LGVRADGSILVGGLFRVLGGQRRTGIGLLNADGSLARSFDFGTNNAVVLAFALQENGRVIIGGSFDTLGNHVRKGLARVNPDGTLDETFAPFASAGVSALALEENGNLIVAGYFGALNGQPRSRLGRVQNTDAATVSLSYDGSTIRWLRAGGAPYLRNVLFSR